MVLLKGLIVLMGMLWFILWVMAIIDELSRD